jgi:hypothetical protein
MTKAFLPWKAGARFYEGKTVKSPRKIRGYITIFSWKKEKNIFF